MSAMRFVPRTFARAFSSTPKPQISRVTFIGRLASAPEMHTTTGGREMIRYSLAVNRGYGESKQTAFWKVASFVDPAGKLGEVMLQMQKGTQVFVEGDIWQSKFENEEGRQVTNVTIAQTKLEILKRPAIAKEGEEEVQGEAPAAQAAE